MESFVRRNYGKSPVSITQQMWRTSYGYHSKKSGTHHERLFHEITFCFCHFQLVLWWQNDLPPPNIFFHWKTLGTTGLFRPNFDRSNLGTWAGRQGSEFEEGNSGRTPWLYVSPLASFAKHSAPNHPQKITMGTLLSTFDSYYKKNKPIKSPCIVLL